MFAIRCIAFVCFDRSLSSLHIWFVHSLFSFQRSIAHHSLRDSLLILSWSPHLVNSFEKLIFWLSVRWISNFHMITSFYLDVNNESYLAVALQKTTSQYYHHFKSMSNRFWKNVSDYRGTKLYHKNVSLVNTSVSASLWIRHPILNCLTTNFFGCAAPEKPSSPEVLTRSIRIPPPLGFWTATQEKKRTTNCPLEVIYIL